MALTASPAALLQRLREMEEAFRDLETENAKLAAENERMRAHCDQEFDSNPDDAMDDGRYVYGCGEYDTVDGKGRPLRNGGRTCNDAGEPYWM